MLQIQGVVCVFTGGSTEICILIFAPVGGLKEGLVRELMKVPTSFIKSLQVHVQFFPFKIADRTLNNPQAPVQGLQQSGFASLVLLPVKNLKEKSRFLTFTDD